MSGTRRDTHRCSAPVAHWRPCCVLAPARLRRLPPRSPPPLPAPTARTTPAASATSSRPGRDRTSTPPRSPPSSAPAPARRTTPTSSSMYEDLVYATPGLTDSTLDDYFKDASFGVKPGDVERTYSPRGDVTIVRDAATASRTSTARAAPGRCSASATRPPRTASSSSTSLRHAGRARALLLRRRPQGNRDMDALGLGRHALHRGRPDRTSTTPCRRALRRPGTADPGRRPELRRRDQPVHRRGQASTRLKMPGEYALIEPPARPRRLEAGRT